MAKTTNWQSNTKDSNCHLGHKALNNEIKCVHADFQGFLLSLMEELLVVLLEGSVCLNLSI